MGESAHLLTVIDEGNGYTPICSCGWAGPKYETDLAAGLAWSMDHIGGESVTTERAENGD